MLCSQARRRGLVTCCGTFQTQHQTRSLSRPSMQQFVLLMFQTSTSWCAVNFSKPTPSPLSPIICLSLCPFREINNVVVFPFPFHILWFIRLQGYFPIPRTKSCLDPYPLIRHPRRPLVLNRGRILFPGFILSSPQLAVNDIAHSLPLGGIGWGFLLTEGETRTIFFILLIRSIFP